MATFGLAGSAGVPAAAVADTVVAPYDVVPELDDSYACVIVEPVAANMGLVAPGEGFLDDLRTECDRVGALLIFDEVITGFRLSYAGAAEHFGVRPDLLCFGKIIGGGLPIGAFGGSAAVMGSLAPEGPVYQAGTLSGNPLATAAGMAALDLLTPAVYGQLETTAARLADGLQSAFDSAGVEAVIPRVGTLVGLFLGSSAPANYDDARTHRRSWVCVVFPRHARQGSGAGARRLRDPVPRSCPLRRHRRSDHLRRLRRRSLRSLTAFRPGGRNAAPLNPRQPRALRRASVATERPPLPNCPRKRRVGHVISGTEPFCPRKRALGHAFSGTVR